MGRAWAWLGWLALAAALWLIAASPAAANAIPGQPVAVCIAPARAGDTVRSILDAPASRFECDPRQTRWAPGDYWVRSAALPAGIGAADALDVRFASLWQDRTTVAVRFADGQVVQSSFDARGLSHRLGLGAIVTVPLPDRHVAVAQVLWHVEGAAVLRSIVALPTLATRAETTKSDLMMSAIYAGFAGLCLALLIYNIALFVAMRHRFQLVYCVMVVGLLGYACTISGVLAWLIPDLDNNLRLRISYVALALSAASAMLFARFFFEERVFAGWFGRAAGVAIGLPVAVALAFALYAPHQIRLLDALFAGSFVPLLLSIVPMLWRAWRLRSNYLWLFAIAWGTPVAMGLLRVGTGLHLVRWNIWIDQTTILSMALEALLSSIAIAYRIRLLADERDWAREQEIAARILADTDPLTGLLNRRAFLRQAIGRHGEQTLLVIDIDHFKRVNEAIGHDGGDEVLRVLARALRAAVPPDALIARIGGEEFAIVMDASRALSARAVLDALRAERMPFDVVVTASVGQCAGPLAREADWKALYRRADQALFAAKAAGRDRARDAGSIAYAA